MMIDKFIKKYHHNFMEVMVVSRKRKDTPDKICPRCGQHYSYIETRTVEVKSRDKSKKQNYYYAVHYEKDENGKTRRRRCYLGPNRYIYVTRLHRDLGLILYGAIVPKRDEKYREMLLFNLTRRK